MPFAADSALERSAPHSESCRIELVNGEFAEIEQPAIPIRKMGKQNRISTTGNRENADLLRGSLADDYLFPYTRKQIVVRAQIYPPTRLFRYEPLSVTKLISRCVQRQIVVAVILNQGNVAADLRRVQARDLSKLAHPVVGNHVDSPRTRQICCVQYLGEAARSHIRLNVPIEPRAEKRSELIHIPHALAVSHRCIRIQLLQLVVKHPVVFQCLGKDL